MFAIPLTLFPKTDLL